MKSLLTDASLPAPPRLGPPVKGSSELLEVSVSVVGGGRGGADWKRWHVLPCGDLSPVTSNGVCVLH